MIKNLRLGDQLGAQVGGSSAVTLPSFVRRSQMGHGVRALALASLADLKIALGVQIVRVQIQVL